MIKILFFIIYSFTINSQEIKYQDEANLAVKSIFVIVSDNSQGVYSKVIKPFVKNYFNKQNRFYFKGIDYVKGPVKLNQSFFDYDSDGILFIETLAKQSTLNIEMTIFITKTKERYVKEFLKLDAKSLDNKLINDSLDRIFKRLPFKGLILSRFSGDKVIVDLGKNSNVKESMILPVYRIQKINKHPYLNTIISINRTKVGEIKIFKISENISFAKIIKENKNDPILKYYKIFKDALPDRSKIDINLENESSVKKISIFKLFNIFNVNEEEVIAMSKIARNEIGNFTFSLPLSMFSYKTNTNLDNDNKSSSLSSGFKLDASLFIDESWILESLFKYQLHSFTPSGGNSSFLNSNFTEFKLYLAYKFVFKHIDLYLKSGYRRINFSSESVPDLSPHTSKTYNSFDFAFSFLGPASQFIDFWFNAYFSLYNSLNQKPSKTGTSDNSIFGFSLNANYKLNMDYSLVYGLNYDKYSSSIENDPNGVISSSISNFGIYLGVSFAF